MSSKSKVKNQGRLRPVRELEKAVKAYERGDTIQAAKIASALVTSHPSAGAHECLGAALYALGKIQKAFFNFQKMAVYDPTNIVPYLKMGLCLDELAAFKQAAESFQIACDLDPEHKLALVRFARSSFRAKNFEDADAAIRRMGAIGADRTADFHALQGMIADSKGDRSAAQAHYIDALALEPDNTRLIFAMVSAGGEVDRSQLEGLLMKRTTTQLGRVDLHYSLGMIHDRAKEHSKAFEHYIAANQALDMEWDPQTLDDMVDAAIEQATPEFFAARKDFGIADASPIFIVGMPRSGTSLIEEILAAHPRVTGWGEHRAISRLSNITRGPVKYPRILDELSREQSVELATSYLRSGPESDVSADKSLSLYTKLGMIPILFPNAKILHVQRDPLDSAVSAFCLHFEGDNLAYTYDLEHLGRAHLGFQRAMEHWHRTLPMPILTVPYEELVADIEPWTRKIIDHCGLDWDDACLNFHQSDRNVFTASKHQVRQKAHTRSCGKWKRYEEHLDPLKRALGLEE